jgi:hypothetical protein
VEHKVDLSASPATIDRRLKKRFGFELYPFARILYFVYVEGPFWFKEYDKWPSVPRREDIAELKRRMGK